MLQAVVSAIATPFTAGSEAVDQSVLRRLIERTIEDGADAVIACASTVSSTP